MSYVRPPSPRSNPQARRLVRAMARTSWPVSWSACPGRGITLQHAVDQTVYLNFQRDQYASSLDSPWVGVLRVLVDESVQYDEALQSYLPLFNSSRAVAEFTALSRDVEQTYPRLWEAQASLRRDAATAITALLQHIPTGVQVVVLPHITVPSGTLDNCSQHEGYVSVVPGGVRRLPGWLSSVDTRPVERQLAPDYHAEIRPDVTIAGLYITRVYRRRRRQERRRRRQGRW